MRRRMQVFTFVSLLAIWLMLWFGVFCMPATAQELARLNPAVLAVVPAAETSPCPSGSNYLSAWNGDYTGDTDKICYNSKASTKDGSINGTVEIESSYGRTENGFRATTVDENIKWVVASSDLISETIGTICVDIYVDADAITDDFSWFEASDGSTVNLIIFYVQNTGPIRAYFYSNSSGQYVTTSTQLAGKTWGTVKYTWQNGDPDKHKVCLNGAGCDEDEEDISPTATFTETLIGEARAGANSTHPRWIDNLRIYNSYDATCE